MILGILCQFLFPTVSVCGKLLTLVKTVTVLHVCTYVLYRCNTTDLVVSTCTVRAHVHVYLCVFGFGDQVHTCIIHFHTLMADHRHYNAVQTMYTIRVTMKPPK